MMTVRQKLDKCKNSLEAHVSRGGGRIGLHGTKLELRYDDLRMEALKGGEWRDYCAAHAFAFSHRGLDFFA